MATVTKFDKIHKPVPYREFFGKMYITPKQMQHRIDLAGEIEDVLFYLFAYWVIAADAEIPIDEIKQDAKERLTSVIEKHTILDQYLTKHINTLIDEVVDATERHNKRKREEQALEDSGEFEEEENKLEKELQEDEDSEEDEKDYWTSRDRAMLISENEANAFDNYIEYREALRQGKKYKTWLTENDERVRFTHMLKEGEKTDINGLFSVGGYKMRFPKDTMYDADASETVNCRCVCVYE